MLILLHGCTTWMRTKRWEKKLDGNCTIMLQAILNKSWRQHPTKQQLYAHLPPNTKTIMQDTAGEVRTNSCDVLLWTPSHGRAKAGRPVRTYIQQLCADMGCSPEDLPEAMRRVVRKGQGYLCWWRDMMIKLHFRNLDKYSLGVSTQKISLMLNVLNL